MDRPTLADVRQAATRLTYTVFDGVDHAGVKKNYDLNIFGVRSANVQANRFDDWLGVYWMNWDVGDWEYHVWPATTDPGSYWLHNFKQEGVTGTAILVEGQYPSSHKIGLHRNEYVALIQNGPLRVYRDSKLDDILDMQPSTIEKGSGFGINIHRAWAYKAQGSVDKWSAGCQVFADPTDFAVFMEICARARNVWGPVFTYTLLTESQLAQ